LAAYKRHRSRERSTRVRRVHWLGRWRARIQVWLENHEARRELRRCASLDPRFARDIGFTSDELAVVCAAPPWKAVTRQPSSLQAVQASVSKTCLVRFDNIMRLTAFGATSPFAGAPGKERIPPTPVA